MHLSSIVHLPQQQSQQYGGGRQLQPGAGSNPNLGCAERSGRAPCVVLSLSLCVCFERPFCLARSVSPFLSIRDVSLFFLVCFLGYYEVLKCSSGACVSNRSYYGMQPVNMSTMSNRGGSDPAVKASGRARNTESSLQKYRVYVRIRVI